MTPEEAKAKTRILGECENLAAAGVTFVAVHFDGYGDSGAAEEVQCFDSEYCAYEEHKSVAHDAAYLQEHFETLKTKEPVCTQNQRYPQTEEQELYWQAL